MFVKQDSMNGCDVLVIGAGHAGIEAAAAAARLGAKTFLVTMAERNVGILSCNPSIGGVGKGHLVREIDALDGLIGRVADASAIHFRVLNRSKGQAVWGPRTQNDRLLYSYKMREILNRYPNLTLVYAKVNSLIIKDQKVYGVVLSDGQQIFSGKTILATGTFLGGIIHVGDETRIAGRAGDPPSNSLSKALRSLDLKIGRMKTGTPPRLEAKTIDRSKLERQPGDQNVVFMSTMTKSHKIPQLSCFITRTNPQVHQIIHDYLHTSAMYSGKISGIGPRYCPSVEDKIVKFAQKASHQVFLEPEGLNSALTYPNGLSTSLATEAQEKLVHLIPGLENCRITNYGYAIEYDYIDPRELDHSLQLRKLENLYLAGQVNGTTGYEEAAAQGLVAGINAALALNGRRPFLPDRATAYLGVMIDDLVNCGVTEPYRMFTARAEYRLSLRTDNAEQRLTDLGIKLGCVGTKRIAHWREKQEAIEELKQQIEQTKRTPHQWQKLGVNVNLDGEMRSVLDLFVLGLISEERLRNDFKWTENVNKEILRYLVSELTYQSYLTRQHEEVSNFRKEEELKIPGDLNYDLVAGLATESREKLKLVKPETLGQANRIPGVNLTSLVCLLAHLKRLQMREEAKEQDDEE